MSVLLIKESAMFPFPPIQEHFPPRLNKTEGEVYNGFQGKIHNGSTCIVKTLVDTCITFFCLLTTNYHKKSLPWIIPKLTISGQLFEKGQKFSALWEFISRTENMNIIIEQTHTIHYWSSQSPLSGITSQCIHWGLCRLQTQLIWWIVSKWKKKKKKSNIHPKMLPHVWPLMLPPSYYSEEVEFYPHKSNTLAVDGY